MGSLLSVANLAMVPLKGGLAPSLTARFGNSCIKVNTSIKYLGVHFDTNMMHDTHVKKVLRNSIDLFSRIRFTIRSKWGLSHEHGRMI